jgi:RimJ/RimL family protein N-acetyltransferase
VDCRLTTDRLRVRPWRIEDAEAALAIYGIPDVTGWLTPATARIGDLPAMRAVLHAWVEMQPNLLPPRGRWAIERIADQGVVGGLAIRLLPPYEVDLELSFQLRLEEWGKGYARSFVSCSAL